MPPSTRLLLVRVTSGSRASLAVTTLGAQQKCKVVIRP